MPRGFPSGKITKHCRCCAKEFPSTKARITHNYCSHPCALSSSIKRKVGKACKVCSAEFNGGINAQLCSLKYVNDKAKEYNWSYRDIQIVLNKSECDICSAPFRTRPNIDHDHATGRIRGALCTPCNIALGGFKDNLNFLKNATTYLSTLGPERDIALILKHAYSRGWISSRDGNVSVRDADSVFISPSGVHKGKLTPLDVLKVSVDDRRFTADSVQPSIELYMHLAVQKHNNVQAVVHLHPPFIVAAMHAGWELENLAAKFIELRRYTRVGANVPYFQPGSEALASRTAANLWHNDVVGQEGHGVTAVGPNPWDAFEHIERLEHICQIVMLSGVKPDDA